MASISKIILTSRIELTTRKEVPSENVGPLLIAFEQYLNQMVIDLELGKKFTTQVYPRFHFQFKETSEE